MSNLTEDLDLEEVDVEKQLQGQYSKSDDTDQKINIQINTLEDDKNPSSNYNVEEDILNEEINQSLEDQEINKVNSDKHNSDEEILDISSEEDSEYDSDYENMEKLENDITKDILHSYHPETRQINYKELLTLSKITRNKKGNIIDPLHTTNPILNSL